MVSISFWMVESLLEQRGKGNYFVCNTLMRNKPTGNLFCLLHCLGFFFFFPETTNSKTFINFVLWPQQLYNTQSSSKLAICLLRYKIYWKMKANWAPNKYCTTETEYERTEERTTDRPSHTEIRTSAFLKCLHPI